MYRPVLIPTFTVAITRVPNLVMLRSTRFLGKSSRRLNSLRQHRAQSVNDGDNRKPNSSGDHALRRFHAARSKVEREPRFGRSAIQTRDRAITHWTNARLVVPPVAGDRFIRSQQIPL